MQCIGQYILSDGSCVNVCPLGQFINYASRKCESCNANCLLCSGPLNSDCFKCKSGYILHLKECLEECPDAYYANNDVCE